MKKNIPLIASSLLLSSMLWGQGSSQTESRFCEKKLAKVEQSLVIALRSDDSPGMQTSAAYVVWRLKKEAPSYGYSRTVVPLMEILNDQNKDCATRIMAARALHELNSSRADRAILLQARFCEEPKVKHICSWLVHERSVEAANLAAVRVSQ